MAKRRRQQENPSFFSYETLKQYRPFLFKLFWLLAIVVCVLFGYSAGYPLVAEGQVWEGIKIGVMYGGGAFGAILVSFYLNRKLKGL